MLRIRALLELLLRMIDAALGHQTEGPARAAALKQRRLVEAELAALDSEEAEIAALHAKGDDAAPLA